MSEESKEATAVQQPGAEEQQPEMIQVDKKQYEQMREIMYPIPDFSKGFVDMVATQAEDALREWLEENNAPKAVLDLLEGLILIHYWKGQEDEGAKQWLVTGIAQVSEAIPVMGGSFHTKDGSI